MPLQLFKVSSNNSQVITFENGETGFELSHVTLQNGPKNVPVEIFIKGKDSEEEFLFATLEQPSCRQFACNLFIEESTELSVKCSKGVATVNLLGNTSCPEDELDSDMLMMDDDDEDLDVNISSKKRSYENQIHEQNSAKKKQKKKTSSDDDDDTLIDIEAKEVPDDEISSSLENSSTESQIPGEIDLEVTSDDEGDDDSSDSSDSMKLNKDVKKSTPPKDEDSSSDESSSEEDDDSDDTNINADTLESLIQKLDKDIPDDNDDQSSSDDDEDSDNSDSDLSEINVDSKVPKVEEVDSSSSDEEEAELTIGEKAVIDDTSSDSNSSSSSTEDDSSQDKKSKGKSNVEKKQEGKNKGSSDDKTEKALNTYVNDIRTYIKKHGKSNKSKIGSNVKKPAVLVGPSYKLGSILGSHSDIFKVSGEFVELKKK